MNNEALEVRVARLEEKEASNEKQIGEIKDLVKEMKVSVDSVNTTVNNAKSGWRVLVWVGGFFVTVGSAIAGAWKVMHG